MKLTSESKKKNLIEVILLIVSLGGIVFVYFVFLAPNNTPSGTLIEDPTSIGEEAAGQTELLPYGSRIDTAILQDEDFQVLKAAPPVTVSPEELGKEDLFAL